MYTNIQVILNISLYPFPKDPKLLSSFLAVIGRAQHLGNDLVALHD